MAQSLYRSSRRMAKTILRPLFPWAWPQPTIPPIGLPIIPPTPGKSFPRRTLTTQMCNYNHAQYLEKAIHSVVTQSRPPDEYLILDDGSTDNSVEIMKRYAAQYPFIRLVLKNENIGFARGREELLQLATGDYIHVGAADDYMLPGFIEQAMRLAEEFPQAGIITGEMVFEYENSLATDFIEIPWWTTGFVSREKYLHEYLEVGDPTSTLSAPTIHRRDAFLEFGGLRSELGIWDISFVLQASALKYGMCYLDVPCYTWVFRNSGMTKVENSKLMQSAETHLNYFNLMRSPAYRDLFSQKFAHAWLMANMIHACRSFAEAKIEKDMATTPKPVQTEPASPFQPALEPTPAFATA
jgi:GT2 family glycosyltransferase